MSMLKFTSNLCKTGKNHNLCIYRRCSRRSCRWRKSLKISSRSTVAKRSRRSTDWTCWDRKSWRQGWKRTRRGWSSLRELCCVVFLIYKSLVRAVKSNVVVHTTASSVNLLVRCAAVWLYLKPLVYRAGIQDNCFPKCRFPQGPNCRKQLWSSFVL